MKGLVVFSLELIFWVAALILLAFSDPAAHHFTLCPLENLGISWCPGCGIGRAIAHIFRGDLSESMRAHWFGIPALLIIITRIYRLSGNTANEIQKYKLKY